MRRIKYLDFLVDEDTDKVALKLYTMVESFEGDTNLVVEDDLELDLNIYVSAVNSTIRNLEDTSGYKRGEIISKVIQHIQETYIDPNVISEKRLIE